MTSVAFPTFLAAFARSSAFLQTAPLTGDRTVPMGMRAALAAILAMTVASVRPPVDWSMIAVVLPVEIALGAAAGFAGRLILAGAEAGGQIIALNFGLGLASSFDPTFGESVVVTRRMSFVFASLAFLIAGGLQACIRIIATAPSSAQNVSQAVQQIFQQGGEILVVAVRFGAPAMIAGLVANLGVSLAAKASPALNLFSVMLAALLLVGGATLMVGAPSFIRDVFGLGRYAIETMARVSGL